MCSLSLCALVACWAITGSGCAMQNLKEANRRLKESNERLIGENTRLEEELAALKRQGEPLEPPALAMKAQDPGRVQGKVDPDLLLDDDDVQVDRTSQGLRFRVPDRVFFALGQATLSTRGQRILDKVSRIINSDFPGHLVRVDGHTDDTPIRKVRSQFPTNWELSSARACTVVRYLVDKGNVNAHRIFPAGFSYYRPVSSGRSANAKSQNRRVEITILNESA